MKTPINIDDQTLARAMALTGLSKRTEVVNLALRRLVQQLEREQILDLAGAVEWEGDLDAMREDRDGSHR